MNQYRHLRQRDTGNGSKSSWRITVRQLESMIRLSESMARLSCSDQVLPKHVKEAYRLLNKSIIRVDQPDIHFDDEEDDEMEVDPEAEDPAAAAAGGDEAAAAATPGSVGGPLSQEPKRQPVKISCEEYKQMAALFVHYLRKKESENIRKSDVLNWYLEEMLSSGDPSQEELLEKKQIVEKVLDRLAYKDNVLIPISKTGLKGRGGDAPAAAADEDEDDPLLIVHPNYADE